MWPGKKAPGSLSPGSKGRGTKPPPRSHHFSPYGGCGRGVMTSPGPLASPNGRARRSRASEAAPRWPLSRAAPGRGRGIRRGCRGWAGPHSSPNGGCGRGVMTSPGPLASPNGREDQLSSQLYRNKQLQDTLLQKEEELARLHEENNNLRQYLNSALIKCLEEKAKKLLSCHGQKNCAILKSTKRRLKEDHCFVPQETPHASKARRNLFNEFTACEEQASPAVDSWVLQTLGLKDVNTIDETSANYSALSSDLGKETYCLSPGEGIDYDHSEGAAAAYSCSHVPPANSSTHPCSEDSPFLPQFSSAPCVSSSVPSVSSLPDYGLPYLTGNLSPNKTEVAFSTSLSPHRNVRTHTFHQGQAFVRRDDDGGWRFTWVPKQAE
ncbi:PREDICTED: geminin coiled-coil domain-containing protein 1 [Aptenodytes forsteri]|uniref:geminin coiled-coil domain-containing protein 1 n=1 Tax=Aptenodytes forsteri TaxID=9233 RepID=UPI0004F49FAC|nr:PREDICTED: geminin coiled-coil domain-containing protein 1 [Aptenodytes forsteri]